MAQKMRAVRLFAPKDIRCVEVDVPHIEKDTQVLIKVKSCGVCGSDIPWRHQHGPGPWRPEGKKAAPAASAGRTEVNGSWFPPCPLPGSSPQERPWMKCERCELLRLKPLCSRKKIL